MKAPTFENPPRRKGALVTRTAPKSRFHLNGCFIPFKFSWPYAQPMRELSQRFSPCTTTWPLREKFLKMSFRELSRAHADEDFIGFVTTGLAFANHRALFLLGRRHTWVSPAFGDINIEKVFRVLPRIGFESHFLGLILYLALHRCTKGKTPAHLDFHGSRLVWLQPQPKSCSPDFCPADLTHLQSNHQYDQIQWSTSKTNCLVCHDQNMTAARKRPHLDFSFPLETLQKQPPLRQESCSLDFYRADLAHLQSIILWSVDKDQRWAWHPKAKKFEKIIWARTLVRSGHRLPQLESFFRNFPMFSGQMRRWNMNHAWASMQC